MDIHSIRQALRTKSVYDIPLRVTFYARVSSESDEQLNSLGNQVSYYEEFIRKNSAWEYVPGYVDEGLSAATTKKREDFHRMVEDGKAGLFDLIITKEITRFARNTLDSILYTRELLNAGVGVFFQNDNINTFDEDSELRLTIMSGIAQDELRKLSSRVKFGHAQAIKKNVVLGNSRIFGYVKDGGRLVIDEDEAPMVRELFELYATGEYSMKQIETLFWEKGYRNHNGKKIAHTTMSGMISNPKYKGYYVGNKVKVIDLLTKKPKFLPPEEWVMFKDETGEIVPAIVSEELWEAAKSFLSPEADAAIGAMPFLRPFDASPLLNVEWRRDLCRKAGYGPFLSHRAFLWEDGELIPIPEPDVPAQSELFRQVMSLPPKYRAAVYLHYYEGYSVKEIAGLLGAKASTVQTWLMRARGQLKTKLKEAEA